MKQYAPPVAPKRIIDLIVSLLLADFLSYFFSVKTPMATPKKDKAALPKIYLMFF